MTNNSLKAGDLRDAMMLPLTFIFILLYGLALFGLTPGHTDDKVIGHVEPIVTIIIGYYFGRRPSKENEQTLKQQLAERTLRADDATNAKVVAESDRAATAAKLEAVKAALSAVAPAATPTEPLSKTLGAATPASLDASAMRSAVVAALKILDA
jgi:hypothetical protein